MKILITSPSLDINQNVSGISSVTRFIIEANSDHKYIHFELGRRDKERRNFARMLKLFMSFMRWIILLAKEKPDLIHFNLAIDKQAILRDSPFIFASKLFQRKLIIHVHGGEYLSGTPVPSWMKPILRRLFKGQTPKIVLSTMEKELLEQRFACENVTVLANCVDLKEAKAFQRNYTEKDIPVLLFLGRISISKGIEYIFQALNSLKKQKYRFRFILAGKGPEEQEYVAKFKDLLGEDFTFCGVVSGADKTAILKTSDIFLLPTFFEGLPVALIETMAFGLVPVTTDVGSIKYVVNNNRNGIIVNKHSSEDIEIAIQKLSKDRKYMANLGTSAREFIFKNYNPNQYVLLLNKIYSNE